MVSSVAMLLSTLVLVALLHLAGSKKVLLVYNHLPKAGGIETKMSFMHAFVKKPGTVKDIDDYPTHHRGSDDNQTLSIGQIEALVASGNPANDWLTLYEVQGLDYLPADRSKLFVVGGIREPCAYYLSDWAYASFVRKKFNITDGPFTPYMAVDPRKFDTSEDKERLVQWVNRFATQGIDYIDRGRLKVIPGAGVLTARFMQSYALPGQPYQPSNVDCWVRNEDLHADVAKCLRQFVQQGGKVPHLDRYLSFLQSQAAGRKINAMGHQGCGFYFNVSTAAAVRQAERFIFDTFAYHDCCLPNAQGSE